ncbi:RNA-binding domain-containing protein [Pseudonocardia sp. WMMC193]|uniref:RNA-binding domain-containing protein n=1 Tax=Pseudonocardia sp. WMMC193 TaxID=2911965 RepID=UPI001F432897|nr:RNA-binding domain-containing protein [Pseudonocardia sp. WMMC193]MCF7551037.1 putative DNA binding domain-containing protein [Pseudonocardia sp. WMMC193]
MQADDLATLVADLRAEGSDLAEVEVKRAQRGFPDSLAPTLSAFGNTPGGGTVIFGLDENAGFQAVGVYDASECKRALGAAVRNSVEPPLTFSASTVQFESKELVVAEVDELPGSSKPCRVTKTKKSYLRSYDGDYPLSDVEEQAFLANRETPRFDIQPVNGTSEGDLDPDLVTVYLRNCRQGSSSLDKMSDAEILHKTGVTTGSDRTLTLGGILSLGTYPQQYFPNLVIQASVAPGPDDPPGTRAVDARKFDGPIPVMLDEALRWVSRNTRTRVQFGADGQGRDETEYPAEAVRELLSNALVHRDLGPYSLGEAITLRLETSQLVLSNPGGLWGLTVAKLGHTNVTSARNGYLVRICQNVRVANTGNRVVEARLPVVFRQCLRRSGRPEWFRRASMIKPSDFRF